MRENRKKTIRIAVLILILLLGIGFAALRTTLKIDGTVNVDKTTWDVHFENVQPTTGSVEASPAPTTNNIDTTEMTYTIGFTKPGDFYEFTVDIVNNGTIDAMIEDVSNKVYQSNGTTETTLPSYLKSTLTYVNGTPINKNHLLSKKNGNTKTVEKVKVRIEFKKDISASDLPSDGDTTLVFKFIGKFKQADDDACPIPTTFEDDDWSTIQCNVKQNPESYPVGATKTVSITGYGTHTVRVANNTTPTECEQTGFSETACGFVVEFTDAIMKNYMQSSQSSTGGWENCYMRNYLNNNTSGIITKLPSELKDVIIDTTVISGHNDSDSSNFETTDKLYLLDAPEIYGSSFTSSIHSAKAYERQLDYYKEQNVTTSNTTPAKKKYSNNETDWWLRSASTDGPYYYFFITGSGSYYNDPANGSRGISPAFRIG